MADHSCCSPPVVDIDRTELACSPRSKPSIPHLLRLATMALLPNSLTVGTCPEQWRSPAISFKPTEPFPLGMRRRREEDPEEERPRKLQTRLPAPSAGGAPDIFRQWALPGSDQTLQQKISSIHEAIKLIDPNLDFSNPCVLTNLPFPSTLRMPEERFKAIDDDKNLHNVIKFPYMGRLKFSELLAAVQRGPFTRGEKLYLYGASGTGKSHMLAAFVCKLVREGKRVVYIPDCRELLENFVDAVREALLFAFYDDLCSWDIIFNARTTSHLQQFLNGRPKHSLYFIIDQRNALDQHNPDLQQKIDVSCSLRCMAYGQLYIFSASANEESSRDADHKQSGINTIYFCAGMTEDETDAWFAHHATSLPNLSQLNRNFVKYITGNIPLLLQPLFEYKDEEFDDTKFLQSTELATVANNIKSFYNGIFTANSKTAEERDLCLRGMMACLMQTSFSIDKKFYDLRYFYFNQGTSIGHSTCGIASQVLMALYRRHNLERLDINRFYSTISASSNPIVHGYLAEHVCLDAIKRHGLPCIDSTLNRPLDAEFFDDVPNWNPFIASTHECRLYLPATFNFANVDAAILRLDRWNRKAYLYPIQVTLARTHKDSETKFYEEQWKNWTEGLSDYEVYSTFVWIDQQQPSNGAIEMVARPTRNGIKEVIPQHNFSHVSIKSVDEKLSQKLEERPL
ncbi:hypothetical protein FS842_003981 [Serendipita sp. 407]|nr:hypothetical protein FS842_003981 [Serendipita sp. 407]